ncbi:MAG: hypothetical protein HYR88_12755 [Verrucomicrobia bacterium]|nr:hypothetical protein [Verrucomicrobiota bacterium]MBI3868166.1 hypothetical protein [Verrucomicrobiota bacterium]
MKSSLPLALVFPFALTAALLSGCGGGGAYAPVNATQYNQETTAKFVLLDAGAQRSVTSPGIQEKRLADGRLEVVANLRNRENRRIEVQVNCVFKDEQHFPVDETPFQVVILTENATEGVKFTSMNDKAKDYTVRVRQSR